MSEFLNGSEEIDMHGVKLPHWQQGEVMQFVTFRLGDALPQAKLRIWKEERNIWKSHHPEPWSQDDEKEYHSRFTAQLERWLDQGAGSCIFRDTDKRLLLENVLMKFQGERIEHHSWIIMPNHVHLLFRPLAPLEKLIQSWKGVSARKIGFGSIWQVNYRDTMIRDVRHFSNAVRYIRRNPVKLNALYYTLWESERAQAIE